MENSIIESKRILQNASKNNKLVVETRKVEVYKSKKPTSKQDLIMKSKDSRRFAEGLKISKKGEHITEKLYPGAGDTLIAEKRKVEVFKDKRKTKVTDSQTGKKGYETGYGYGYEGIKNLKQYSESGEYADGTQKPQFKKKGYSMSCIMWRTVSITNRQLSLLA